MTGEAFDLAGGTRAELSAVSGALEFLDDLEDRRRASGYAFE
jgi:hypothetical protein